YYANSGADGGSYQVAIYESGISQIQFNYSPTYGSPVTTSYTHGYTGTPFSYNGFTWPGSWDYYSAYQSGSYYYLYDLRAVCGIKGGAGNQCIKVDWNGNGWDASKPIVYNYN